MINPSIPSEHEELKPRITVIGVGGAGGNAVNNMIRANLEGVEFLTCNTDAQALQNSLASHKIQLGPNITRGLGAGARADVGRAAAEEAIEPLMERLAGSNMVFITAGMGGGTGTGAAPVIARASREQGILTVGVVTKPFHFEGSHRMRQAEAGIEALQEYVDTLIVIPNQNLFRIANENTTFADAFNMADQVLHSGVRGVTDLMVMPGLINLDFNDIRAVMSEMGKAMMGTGEAEGGRRAIDAAEAAISNPLLDDVSMKGARGVLINITGGMDMTLFEVDEAANRIRDEVDPDANIIFGSTFDQNMSGRMRVSVVATGIDIESMRRSAGGNSGNGQRALAPPANMSAAVAQAAAQAATQQSSQTGFNGNPRSNNAFMAAPAAPAPANNPAPAAPPKTAQQQAAATFQQPLRAQATSFTAAPANNSQPANNQSVASSSGANVVGINTTAVRNMDGNGAKSTTAVRTTSGTSAPVYATQGSAALAEPEMDAAEWGYAEVETDHQAELNGNIAQSPWQAEETQNQFVPAAPLSVAPLVAQPNMTTDFAGTNEDLFPFGNEAAAAPRKTEAKKRGPSLFERVTNFGGHRAPAQNNGQVAPQPNRTPTDQNSRQNTTSRRDSVSSPTSNMFGAGGAAMAQEAAMQHQPQRGMAETMAIEQTMQAPRAAVNAPSGPRLSQSDEDLLEIPAFLRRQAN